MERRFKVEIPDDLADSGYTYDLIKSGAAGSSVTKYIMPIYRDGEQVAQRSFTYIDDARSDTVVIDTAEKAFREYVSEYS
jgi:hypothetical protein